MSEVATLRLELAGQPQGQPRPRFRPGQKPYPDRKQVLAVGEIRRAWKEAGEPHLPDVALSLEMWLYVSRPAGHFKRDGSLSAEGQRYPYPSKQKPDIDNAIKLVGDALNQLAWRDDVRFVHMACRRYWGEWPKTIIVARALGPFVPFNEDAAPEDAAPCIVTASNQTMFSHELGES